MRLGLRELLVYFTHYVSDTHTALYAVIQLEVKVRSVLEHDAFGHTGLVVAVLAVELVNGLLRLVFGADHTHVNIRMLEVLCDFYIIDGHQHIGELVIAHDHTAQFTLDQLTHSEETVVHWKGKVKPVRTV